YMSFKGVPIDEIEKSMKEHDLTCPKNPLVKQAGAQKAVLEAVNDIIYLACKCTNTGSGACAACRCEQIITEALKGAAK
ncbi:MAG: hypothetical protein WC450_12570, partial [Candidatus Omnitrophota bacterium]